jgi:hypothetical protein
MSVFNRTAVVKATRTMTPGFTRGYSDCTACSGTNFNT